jgi:hypothetical protein
VKINGAGGRDRPSIGNNPMILFGYGLTGGTGVTVPTPTYQYDAQFAAGHVTKDGSNNITAMAGFGDTSATTLAQGTTANAPLWVSAAQNGLDAAEFNFTGPVIRRVLATGLPAKTELGFTVMFAWCPVSLPGAAGEDVIISHANGASGNEGFYLSLYDASGTRRIRYMSTSAVQTTATCGTVTANTWEIFTYSASASANDTAATQTARVNGNAVTVTGTPNYQTIAQSGTAALILGSATGVTNTHRLGRVLYWRSALSTPQMQTQERALGALYGITVA